MNAWIFLLLVLTIPFSTEYHLAGGLSTDFPDELLMWVFSLVSIWYLLWNPAALGRKTFSHPLILILFVLITWTILSTIFSTNKIFSIKLLLAKGWYITSFVLGALLVFRNKKLLAQTAIALTAAMSIVAFLILIRHGGKAFSFASVNEAVIPYFRNHVNYSALLVCTIPVCIAILALSKNKNGKVLVGLVLVVLLAALFFSYARGAWLALLVGGIAWWLISKRLLFITWLAAVLVIIGLVFWLKQDDRYLRYAHDYKTTIFHKDFSEHFVSTYKLKDLSTAERFYRWIAGVRMIKDYWLTGSGPNTFYPLYKEYTVPAYKTWVSDNPERSTVHNYFLLTAIEQGIPGLLFLLLLLGAMIYYAEKIMQKSKDAFTKIAAITTGVIIVIIMVLNFLSDLVETDKIGSLFFISIATLVYLDLKEKTENQMAQDLTALRSSG